MKRIFVIVLASLIAGASAGAQNFEPREFWPYKYYDFQPGSIFDGQKTTEYDLLNVCVWDGHLHSAQSGTIMEMAAGTIVVARLGQDVWLNVGGRLMQMFNETEHGAVVRSFLVDTDELGKADIGYGKSSTASTQNVSLMSLSGSNMNTKSLISAQDARTSGMKLPVKGSYYIVVDGIAIKAVKSEVASQPGIDKDALKAYLKSNKVRWTRPDDLAGLVEFIHSQKAAK